MKNINLLICLLFIASMGFAQPEDKKEKIKAMKIGYFTNELQLTTDEAQKFWPVYNEFQKEMEDLRKDRKENREYVKSNHLNMSDAELEKAVDKVITYSEKDVTIRKKYHSRFKEVLPMKKVLLFYKAEHEFKRVLLERIKQRRHESMMNGGRSGQQDRRF
ncbi:MAG: hypothetical protein IH946_00735 [Bacteroidetes bacterium]|nr:hypothetical protein [Bacteroidota bacterium]